MLVALSGTPGTGKTTIATRLQHSGYQIYNLNELAFKNNFILGVDTKRQAKILDIPKLNRYIKNVFSSRENIIILEGLATHLLKCMQYIIILRCHPQELTRRLQQRQWSREKIKENVEAETLDIILCEATELHPEQHIFEIDTTAQSVEACTQAILEIIHNNFKPIEKYTIGTIDWSEEILNDYKI
ncbi:MAG: adenylate kinase family protein [Candidatus Thermoplasmatota archaeon]